MSQILSVTEQKALRGLLRQAQENWTKVGIEPYKVGEQGTRSFDGNLLEAGFIPGLISIPENNNAGSPTPILSGSRPRLVRYRRRTWRGGVRYLWEDTIADQIGYYQSLVKGLAEAAQYSLETLYHEPFFRATDTAYIGGWDQKSLLNSAHLLLGGGTWNNQFAYATPTDVILRQIEQTFDTLPDPYGRPYAVNKITIFTSTSLIRTFEQLLNARTAITNPLAGGTVNPNANIPPAFTAGRFTVIGSPYLNNVSSGNVYFALGQGHKMFVANAFNRERMFELNDPPAFQHEVWWSGNVGWTAADRVIGYI
jgi:hypothetical protein